MVYFSWGLRWSEFILSNWILLIAFDYLNIAVVRNKMFEKRLRKVRAKYKILVQRELTLIAKEADSSTDHQHGYVQLVLRKYKRGTRKHRHRPFRLRHVRHKRGKMLMLDLLQEASKNHELNMARNIPNPEGDETFLAFATAKTRFKKEMYFDTDSFPIKVDNCCTTSISPSLEDFIPETLQPVHTKCIAGISGIRIPITQKGTLCWKIIDDEGTTRDNYP